MAHREGCRRAEVGRKSTGVGARPRSPSADIKVGPVSSNLPAPALIPIDLSAATCLPGLIDVRTHLTIDPTDLGYEGLGISVPRSAIKGVKNARLTLRAGFTTVRDVRGDG